MATNCPKCFAVQNEELQDMHGKARILEAHQAYLDEKVRKEALEKELKELGNAILEERTTVKTGRYIALQKEIDKADREVNYWARRVADRITEYREENQ